jgi:hypothetical protein
MSEQEMIARLIYPEAFGSETAHNCVVYRNMAYHEARADALTKATAILTTLEASRTPGMVMVLSAWKPSDMTPETAPEWLHELSPEEYTRRRNDENREALRSLEFHGDWLKMAASHLHCAGTMSPEFGSYSHTCLIMAEALMQTRAMLAASPTPSPEGAE